MKAEKTGAVNETGHKTQRARVGLLEYGAGNVRSVYNALASLGVHATPVGSPDGIASSDALVFPGVGSFHTAMASLEQKELVDALKEFVLSNKPFLGVCLGMQLLFDGSDEAGGCEGLSLVPGQVEAFPSLDTNGNKLSVPHMGWNTLSLIPSVHSAHGTTLNDEANGSVAGHMRSGEDYVYFVHSHRAQVDEKSHGEWVAATCEYGGSFVAAVERGNTFACQFHPEKSAGKGLELYRRFLLRAGALEPSEGQEGEDAAFLAALSASRSVAGDDAPPECSSSANDDPAEASSLADEEQEGRPDSVDQVSSQQQQDISMSISWSGLSKRVIACLDVRANDEGDLVVTKGDSYDVRDSESDGGEVRNLGKPVDLAERYYLEGADEITFLNITGFRDFPLADLPMLEVVRRASERVFVPLTVGGGIRDFTDADGVYHSALDVAAEYFRSGADKVSIGSDAVYAAEEYIIAGRRTGDTAIERISQVYGRQAVVVSIDPRRVYISDPSSVSFKTSSALQEGPQGERFCWYQCTVKGGREARDIGAVELAQAVEALGAGEILLNCIDEDGQGNGFDLALVDEVASAVNIPVVASSGAGKTEHFAEVFRKTRASAALAAGIFHREEVSIADTKEHMLSKGVPVRR